jgi:CDGSH-type Zn-finger protein
MTNRPNRPISVNLEPGTYRFCRCGLSAEFPFCDGAHEGTDEVPKKFSLEFPQPVMLCGCGATVSAPYCDGSHRRRPLEPE